MKGKKKENPEMRIIIWILIIYGVCVYHLLVSLWFWIISIRLRTPVNIRVQYLAVSDENPSRNNGIVCTLDALTDKR